MSNSRGGRGGKRPPLPRDVQVSKKLSKLLRHDAEKEGLKLGAGGFVNLQDVLNNRSLRSLNVTFEEVQQIVLINDKQRFAMVPADAQGSEATAELDGQTPLPSSDPKDYLIRANQGHSIKVDVEGLLQPITEAEIPETAVHGTNHSAWPRIVASGGLKPMGRTHVHFASGLPSGFKSVAETDNDALSAPVISGMRNSSTILIFVDVKKAMDSGIKFWLSENGVILSTGNEHGVLPLDFFKTVEDRKGAGVLVEDGKVIKEPPTSWGGKGKGKG